ncbi:MAG: hypothetical protein ACKVUS_13450 [Saprospiraceae bacterium]
MSVAEIKNDLVLQILQTNDQLLLEHLAQYFQNLLTNKDWSANLSDAQKALAEEEEAEDRQEERIPLADYVAQRKARAHA